MNVFLTNKHILYEYKVTHQFTPAQLQISAPFKPLDDSFLVSSDKQFKFVTLLIGLLRKRQEEQYKHFCFDTVRVWEKGVAGN